MLPVKIILSIITVSVNVFDAETYEVIDTVQPDLYKITGAWHVVAVSTSRTDFPQFRCWTIHISEIYPYSYGGFSYFTEMVENARKLASFRANLSDRTEAFVVFNVSLTYEASAIDFKLYHMLMRPDMLVWSMVGDDKFFDFLILSADSTLSDNDKEMLRADIYIDNIKCAPDERTEIINPTDNLDLFTNIKATGASQETEVPAQLGPVN